jgi:hypothetical protein
VNGFDFIAKSFRTVNKYHPANHMGGSAQREVVLEIEHIKVIRKRAKTNLRFCRDCNRTTDFISVASAADLFSTTPVELFEFTQSYVCHFHVEREQNILLCLTDLLTAMSKRMSKGTVKLLGESKNEEPGF